MRREAWALWSTPFEAAFEMTRMAEVSSVFAFAASPAASASRNFRTCVRTAEVMPWLRARCFCACRFCFSAELVLATRYPQTIEKRPACVAPALRTVNAPPPVPWSRQSTPCPRPAGAPSGNDDAAQNQANDLPTSRNSLDFQVVLGADADFPEGNSAASGGVHDSTRLESTSRPHPMRDSRHCASRGLAARPLPAFGLVPVAIHLLERALARSLAGLAQSILDVVEARFEAPHRRPQGLLGMDLDEAAQVGEGEEEVAELVLDLLLTGCAGRAARHRLLQLDELLADLDENSLHVGPVESDCACLLGDALRPHESGKTRGHAADGAARSLARRLALVGLDPLPVLHHFPRAGNAHVAEDAGAAAGG